MMRSVLFLALAAAAQAVPQLFDSNETTNPRRLQSSSRPDRCTSDESFSACATPTLFLLRALLPFAPPEQNNGPTEQNNVAGANGRRPLFCSALFCRLLRLTRTMHQGST
eukprot:COSAG04_NODE_1791_length_5576_cov_6.266387_2_plen_110_part_00